MGRRSKRGVSKDDGDASAAAFAPLPYLRSITLNRTRATEADYALTLPIMQNFTTLNFHPAVTFFVGENGSGKSTLLEAIAAKLRLNPEGGNQNSTFATRESHSKLHESLDAVFSFKRPRQLFFLRAESLYNLATYIDDLDFADAVDSYGGKSLHAQSHGESFLAIFLNKLKGRGLYLFDEPEAALSPVRQLAALTALHELVQRESQCIIATHSPILLAYPNSQIYHFGPQGLQPIAYEETEHYTVTRDFLNRREAMLKVLMET
jgi:predicted ATPase